MKRGSLFFLSVFSSASTSSSGLRSGLYRAQAFSCPTKSREVKSSRTDGTGSDAGLVKRMRWDDEILALRASVLQNGPQVPP
jgi:hypothetical protein